jgi:hypothetical protein
MRRQVAERVRLGEVRSTRHSDTPQQQRREETSMKMQMLAVSAAVMLSAAAGGAYAQSSAPAPSATPDAAGTTMLCSDFTALSADAQDSFLKGYQLGIQQSGGVSGEMTGAIGSSDVSGAPAVTPPAGASGDQASDVASNSGVSTPAGDNAAAGASSGAMSSGVHLPDLASITSSCQTNPTGDISQYLGGM